MSRRVNRLRRVAGVALLAALATGCGGSQEPASPAASEPETAAADSTPSPTAASPTADVPGSDICELLTTEEVTAVIGAAHEGSVAIVGTIADGGQCVWTTDAAGDLYATGASNLELVLWVPGGINPVPSEAPAAGSDEVVETSNGSYFASADRVLLLQVTGEKVDDAAVVEQTRALVTVLRSRL